MEKIDVKEGNNMSIVDNVKGWLFSIAIKKGVVSAAKLLVSYAISHGIKLVVVVHGVNIDLQSEAAMIIAINSVLTMFRNYLKVKYPKPFGWL